MEQSEIERNQPFRSASCLYSLNNLLFVGTQARGRVGDIVKPHVGKLLFVYERVSQQDVMSVEISRRASARSYQVENVSVGFVGKG